MNFKKINSKNVKKICCIISIFGLLIIFFKFYQYKKKTLQEMYIEHLQEQDENIDERQNISSQPDQPTDKEISSPNYLELTDLSVNSVKNYVTRTVAGAIKNIRPDTQGPPGKIGPKGEKGDSGGIHTFRGSIRSISNPNLFLGRNTNKLTIGSNDYTNKKLWIYTNDNKLKSVYDVNDCLNATNDSKLEISKCPTASTWKYYGKTGQIQTMKPIDGHKKCLTFKNTPENGKDSPYGLSLDNCANDPLCDNKDNCPMITSQAWLFN